MFCGLTWEYTPHDHFSVISSPGSSTLSIVYICEPSAHDTLMLSGKRITGARNQETRAFVHHFVFWTFPGKDWPARTGNKLTQSAPKTAWLDQNLVTHSSVQHLIVYIRRSRFSGKDKSNEDTNARNTHAWRFHSTVFFFFAHLHEFTEQQQQQKITKSDKLTKAKCQRPNRNEKVAVSLFLGWSKRATAKTFI